MARIERAVFEKALDDALRRKFRRQRHIKVEKNLIIAIRTNTGRAMLQCIHVNWAHGYFLMISSNSDELSKFVSEAKLPYRSRLTSRYHFCLTTLAEKDCRFAASLNRHAEIPPVASRIDRACRHIADAISEFYMPHVENFINMNPRVVADVMASPEFYAFPLATALCAAKRNGWSFADLNFPEFLSKELCGDPAFDEALARRTLCAG